MPAAAVGCWPRRSSARAWRSSTARSSTSRCPALQAELDATLSDVQWVVEAYALLLAALLLVGGSLGDRFGRRRVFAVGVVVFAAASALVRPCARRSRQLIAARALQGVGAALLVPGSLALISASFPERERGRAIGTWSGFSAITAALGPAARRLAVEHLSWRWVFFLNVPLALAVLAIASGDVPESARRTPAKRLDWPGAAARDRRPGRRWSSGSSSPSSSAGVAGLAPRSLGFLSSSRRRAGADAAAVALPLAHVQRRQPADVPPLRGAGRRRCSSSRST